MRRILRKIRKAKLMLNRRFIYLIFIGLVGSFIVFMKSDNISSILSISSLLQVDYRRRPECTCTRPDLFPLLSTLTLEQSESQSSLCSHYATRRGPHQRIISISLFGPREAKRFILNRTLNYLDLLIKDMNQIYSDGFILRVYHDNTIDATNVICPIECEHPNVDFCDMSHKLYIPPKIWRFIPAGDPLVDVMMSRDLDSALTERERAAVNVWLNSNKLFHVMRDHPQHSTSMLGGMWGFRPSLSPNLSRIVHDKIHDKELIKRYVLRADQAFLTAHVWPHAKSSAIVHDSFRCKSRYGHKTEPFPTQRPSANQTNCFIGCFRPCCGDGKMPFGECPKACRPKDHPEWIYC